jgi:hypothetical protein
VLAGDDQVRGLQHRLHAHRKQAIEVDRAQRVVLGNLGLLLQDHGAFVEAVVGAEDREAGLLVAAGDRPVDRARAAVFRQQRGVVLDRAVLRDVHEFLRRELEHERHDADVGAAVFHRLRRVGALERGKLEHLQPLPLRCDFQRIRFRAFLLRRAKNTRHRVASREKRLEHRFAEVLLSNDRYFHF